MYCENCGHKLPVDAAFCPNCGHNVKQDFSSKAINFKNQGGRWSKGNLIISILLVCIIGLIFVNFYAMGSLTSINDEPPATYENTYSSVSYDDSNDESYTNVVDDTPTSTESSYSSESSSGYSQAQDSSDNYESSSSGGSYVGSVNSDKFHHPSCGYANKIKPGNLITFSSRDDAIASGYSPCKACSP